VSRRAAAMVVLAAITVALSTYLLGKDAEMRDAGGPGIVSFELAFTEERAAEIRGDWGEAGRDAARTSLRVDFAYLLAYGAFLLLAVTATRDAARSRNWRRLAALGSPAVLAATAAPSFDAIENVWLLICLEGEGGDVAPLLGGLFACLKFAALAAALLYVLAGLAARLRDRRGART
jgi:hypothetical protein